LVNLQTVETFDWIHWQPTDRAVIAFVRQEPYILLIRKKRGLGSGKINGPGGRLEPGETYLEAAVRETQEEVGITPHDLRQVANLSFVFADGYSLYGEVFLGDSYSGHLIETDEADPFWCRLDEIPYTEMWEDDRLWLPHVLGGAYVIGKFLFDGEKMLSHAVSVLPAPGSGSAASASTNA
jgi:8-oxo-dGTP diphosphatase